MAGCRLPHIWRLGEVASCLDTACMLAGRGWLEPWDSVLAVSQTAGRGQLRRQWVSPPGNIYAALRLPLAPPFDGTAAAPVMGMLLAQGLRQDGWPTLLKWPNDLVLCGTDGIARKLAGILLEERGGVLLAGIGINVASAPPDAALRADAALTAVSLEQAAALGGLPRPLAEVLWQRLVMHMYSAYNNGHSLSRHWKTRAEDLLLWRGENVEVHDEGRLTRGRLAGLGPDGRLCLSVNGRFEEFLSGSLRLTGRSS